MVAVEKMSAELEKACHWGGAVLSPWTGLWYLHDHGKSLKTHVADSLADTIGLLNLIWAQPASGMNGDKLCAATLMTKRESAHRMNRLHEVSGKMSWSSAGAQVNAYMTESTQANAFDSQLPLYSMPETGTEIRTL